MYSSYRNALVSILWHGMTRVSTSAFEPVILEEMKRLPLLASKELVLGERCL
jgi:hypothetical protein